MPTPTACTCDCAKGTGGITRTWQFRRREGGKLSVVTLNTYPTMSLKEARLRAAELTARRDMACPTVTEAAEQWLTERVNTTLRVSATTVATVSAIVVSATAPPKPTPPARAPRHIDSDDVYEHNANASA